MKRFSISLLLVGLLIFGVSAAAWGSETELLVDPKLKFTSDEDGFT